MLVCLFQQETIERLRQYTLLLVLDEFTFESDSEAPVEVERPTFQQYHDAMASFKGIKWKRDLERKKSSLTGAGKGIFAVHNFDPSVCIALYSGHLVDDSGTIVITCPTTAGLFTANPYLAARPFSASHCAKVKSMRTNLMVDGSHHACSNFDLAADRADVPWGSCLNSSVTETKANCILKWCTFIVFHVLFIANTFLTCSQAQTSTNRVSTTITSLASCLRSGPSKLEKNCCGSTPWHRRTAASVSYHHQSRSAKNRHHHQPRNVRAMTMMMMKEDVRNRQQSRESQDRRRHYHQCQSRDRSRKTMMLK
jgi:hypothetical protein